MKKLLLITILILIIIISLPLIFAAGGGGGGGSGGSGGSSDSSSSGIFTPIIFSKFRTEHSEILNEQEPYRLTLSNNLKVAIYLTQINTDSIIFSLYEGHTIRDSSVIDQYTDASMNVNEIRYIDLDDNGKIDLSLQLTEIKAGKAYITSTDMRESTTMEELTKKEQPKEEEKFPCAELTDIKARVKCRIELPEEEFDEELKLYYLPEECRSLQGIERAKCITTYKNVQPCWKFPQDQERVNCVRQAIGFQRGIASEKAVCAQKPNEEKQQCFDALKENAYTIIKFRFYNLEERAEEYLEQGVSPDTIAEFVTTLELKKQEFNTMQTIDDKKQIVRDVKALWIEFKKTIEQQLGEINE